MKAIVFGVGNYYEEQKEKLKKFGDISIIAFADNNTSMWNKELDGSIVISPKEIQYFSYDKVVIMSIYVRDIYEQLLKLGVDADKIIVWEKFCTSLKEGKIQLYMAESVNKEYTKKILFLSTMLNYNGGSLSIVYAAEILKNKGNVLVILATPGGDERFIRETVNNGISVAVCSRLPYIFDEEKRWICQFDMVMVNVFQMMQCAIEISKFCPVLWWVHEPEMLYGDTIRSYPDSLDTNKFAHINIYAVSKKAQNNFNQAFSNNVCKRILMLGIPDKMCSVVRIKNTDEKLVFANIGTIHSIKAQDIFLKAASMIEQKNNIEFWLIGKIFKNEYCQIIERMAACIKSAKLKGELTRTETYSCFSKIDVLVCTSQEETLSITVIEAMMFGKVCITTENTGIAEYIDNGVNGFVVPCNRPDVLAGKMQWLIDHRDKAKEIGMAARKTYEKFFSMEVFGRNLEIALKETMDEWGR